MHSCSCRDDVRRMYQTTFLRIQAARIAHKSQEWRSSLERQFSADGEPGDLGQMLYQIHNAGANVCLPLVRNHLAYDRASRTLSLLLLNTYVLMYHWRLCIRCSPHGAAILDHQPNVSISNELVVYALRLWTTRVSGGKFRRRVPLKHLEFVQDQRSDGQELLPAERLTHRCDCLQEE